jgi:AraC-like DNA-binding protein/quercetin dioxygenase-like cupin family protein
MEPIVKPGGGGRLEPLCGRPAGDGAGRARIRFGSGAEGIERLEAYFSGQAFAPHRHDTYAIGVTLAGVQTFRYRGEQRHCLPGQFHILHPDEVHDGGAGTDEGFGYRILYLDPRLVQEALGGGPLPFAPSPVVDAALLPEGSSCEAWEIDAPIDEVSRIDIVVAMANLLVAASSEGSRRPAAPAFARVSSVRDSIAARPAERRPMAELERLAGLDRWTLARQFRALFGTSPSRFRTLRQLDGVRRSLLGGVSLAQAALEAGFADQSHMSRRFKSAYGLTPAAWVSAIAQGPGFSRLGDGGRPRETT